MEEINVSVFPKYNLPLKCMLNVVESTTFSKEWNEWLCECRGDAFSFLES